MDTPLEQIENEYGALYLIIGMEVTKPKDINVAIFFTNTRS